ncbi:MAG: DUF3891 family protein [Acidobacteria bacterium]|nr:DUF3891 family protein [Acidobacteriota bacterium]
MFKTLRDKKMWLVSQPDHAEVAGLLAANWGNDEFARPGHFANSGDPERLRAETVLAIAQHDNGWWEWEATPELSVVDGLPLDLIDVLKNQQDAMNRWRLGIPRFSPKHPYVSLLISFHAYWLYTHGCQTDPDPAFTHPLFWKGSSTHLMGDKLDTARSFVGEIKEIQDELTARLRKDPACAAWVDTEHLNPHVRLLQLLDGLSLSLCSPHLPARSGNAKGLGEDGFDLLEVPRRSWEDRVTIKVKPVSERRIVCEPYPFNVDPLPVIVPARILDWPAEPSAHFQSWWHSKSKQPIRFEYCSA